MRYIICKEIDVARVCACVCARARGADKHYRVWGGSPRRAFEICTRLLDVRE